MTPASSLSVGVALAVSAAMLAPLAAGPGPVRLVRISSIPTSAGVAIVLEASEPVAYVTTQPDPLTLMLDLRNATAGGVENTIGAGDHDPVAAVQVAQAKGSDGIMVARVHLYLRDPAPHRVTSARNVIRVEFDRVGGGGAATRRQAQSVLSSPRDARSTPRAGGIIRLIGTPVEPTPSTEGAATLLRAIETSGTSQGLSVTLKGNGRLQPGAISEARELPPRLLVDFPDLASAVPAVTTINVGPVQRIRVGVHSRRPLVTRVVIDLTKAAAYRIEPPEADEQDLRIVFPSESEPGRAPAVASANVPVGLEAAPRGTGTVTLDPLAALRTAPAAAPGQPSTAAVQQPTPPPAPQPPLAPEPAAQTPAAGERQYTGQPISLDFQNADLRSVLRTFAEISGLNIVIDPAVQGTVDVALRDVPWDQALDIILRANKLGYVVDGTVVRIAPISTLQAEEEEQRKLREAQDARLALEGLTPHTVTLSYAKASDVATLLTASRVVSPHGQVQVDERTNTLIITDLPDNMARVRELIATLDQPQPQVEIEARIVQTSRDFARALGIQWGIRGRVSPELGNTTPLAFPNQGSLTGRTGATQGPNGVQTAVNLPVTVAPPTSAIGLALGAVNGALNLDVAISALESSGDLRVLSTPRVITQNNVAAEILQGTQIPIQTVANNTVTVNFKDAALILRVTPQITAANTVIMNVALENSSPDFTKAVNGIPPINTQRANTTVQVSDSETTVIGGVFVSSSQTANDRTPFLHRVPLLGWLFKRDSLTEASDELLIFLTPHIVR